MPRVFSATFAASENEEEGLIIKNLVTQLLGNVDKDDIEVFTVDDNQDILGCAIFSRLTFLSDSRNVFILSPMAVSTQRQGQNLGQTLLTHALDELRKRGVEVAVTYGDPAFYSKVGFEAVSENMVPSPLPLSQPEGWLAQSLTDTTLTPIQGPCQCVVGLDDPAIW